MSLFTIVYVSKATQEMSDDVLMAILNTARAHNSANDITGMLLFRDGFFIQALEGREHAIDALFDRIKQDMRHCTVLQLYKQPIAERRFSQWAMGFESPGISELKQVEGFSDYMHARQLEPGNKFALQFEGHVDSFLEAFRA